MKKNYLSKFYPQRTLSLLGLFLLMSSYLMAQTVSGIVTSKSGEKLPGVSVLVKGTTKGTATDSEGKF
ncbi:MAG: carboxypeptidase-like regulatory domain-containing protein, partial [Leadbetterella sp.]|nr:carboxypeptidase-like regulatory domain-containing protein [Leadbetterella sp.]